jgi:DNA-directed RNA polymerase specialized sigma subunit
MLLTDHVRRKHDISGIYSERERLELIMQCSLDDTDREILRMRYVKHQDFGFIADALGLAYPTVIKRHRRALAVFQAIAAARVNSV